MTATETNAAVPVATYASDNVEVALFRDADNYRFVIAVQGERVSLIYQKVPNAGLQSTAYEGDPMFFEQLSKRQFHEVENAVWLCMRDTTCDEHATHVMSTTAPAEPT
ncbi:hypothetical protein J4763_07145 [Burkholderia pseudomallei]|uniref:hypothetical protein n=1 Tax=Burkholderia pseudomallei TaxID=28450 RepID=UPI001AAE900D|nr:hypothetical protein [Burkholderia pseudomallei]MBO3056565.1 hypothetical protein [Burkholderia pseudomallei]